MDDGQFGFKMDIWFRCGLLEWISFWNEVVLMDIHDPQKNKKKKDFKVIKNEY